MTRDWLTPDTAIGRRLPCGARVVDARPAFGGSHVWVDFNVAPIGTDSHLGWIFNPDGTSSDGKLPALVPPSAPAAPAGVFVTREGLCDTLGMEAGNNVADALGLPPDPPKVAPWEAAYRADWRVGVTDNELLPVRWAVEWCVARVMDVKNSSAFHADAGKAHKTACDVIRARIMGDDA